MYRNRRCNDSVAHSNAFVHSLQRIGEKNGNCKEEGMGKTILAFGEILWDILPSISVIGGAAFNFAYRADSLGNNATIVSRLGEDELGQKALAAIDRLGMRTDFVQTDSVHPTGTVDVFFDEQKNPDYTIHEHVAYDYIEYTAKLEQAVKDADCIYFGTLAQREKVSRNTLHALLEIVAGTHILYDINLRKGCYTKDTIAESLVSATILKLNEQELHMLNDMFAFGESSLRRIAGKFVSEFQLEYLLITLGHRGAFGVDENGQEVYGRGYRVELIDPVGAGDACTAGFIDRLLAGTSFEDAVAYGNALGALVATQEGATQPLSRKRVEEFIRSAQRSEAHPEVEDL